MATGRTNLVTRPAPIGWQGYRGADSTFLVPPDTLGTAANALVQVLDSKWGNATQRGKDLIEGNVGLNDAVSERLWREHAAEEERKWRQTGYREDARGKIGVAAQERQASETESTEKTERALGLPLAEANARIAELEAKLARIVPQARADLQAENMRFQQGLQHEDVLGSRFVQGEHQASLNKAGEALAEALGQKVVGQDAQADALRSFYGGGEANPMNTLMELRGLPEAAHNPELRAQAGTTPAMEAQMEALKPLLSEMQGQGFIDQRATREKIRALSGQEYDESQDTGKFWKGNWNDFKHELLDIFQGYGDATRWIPNMTSSLAANILGKPNTLYIPESSGSVAARAGDKAAYDFARAGQRGETTSAELTPEQTELAALSAISAGEGVDAYNAAALAATGNPESVLHGQLPFTRINPVQKGGIEQGQHRFPGGERTIPEQGMPRLPAVPQDTAPTASKEPKANQHPYDRAPRGMQEAFIADLRAAVESGKMTREQARANADNPTYFEAWAAERNAAAEAAVQQAAAEAAAPPAQEQAKKKGGGISFGPFGA